MNAYINATIQKCRETRSWLFAKHALLCFSLVISEPLLCFLHGIRASDPNSDHDISTPSTSSQKSPYPQQLFSSPLDTTASTPNSNWETLGLPSPISSAGVWYGVVNFRTCNQLSFAGLHVEKHNYMHGANTSSPFRPSAAGTLSTHHSDAHCLALDPGFGIYMLLIFHWKKPHSTQVSINTKNAERRSCNIRALLCFHSRN